MFAVAALAAGSAPAARGGQEPAAVPAPQPAVQPSAQSAAPPGYVWAAACKDCHKEIYASWENTKHARALNRLNKEEQQKDCIGCHATGAKALVEENGKPLNAGVQCESCHGPGAAHAADPKTLPRKITESSCTVCHSERSPHYRGFYFQGMANLSHPLRKT